MINTTKEIGQNSPRYFNFATDVVDHWASSTNNIALITANQKGPGQVYRFQDISQESSKLANLLLETGIRQGDRVIVLLPKIAEWQISMVALLRIGAVPIPCITMLTRQDLEYRIEHSGAVGVIAPDTECHKLNEINSLKVKIAIGDVANDWISIREASKKNDNCEPAQVAADDIAIIYYTSGSTGKPKGVTHSARALWAWKDSAEHWLGLNENERIWCTADTGWSKAGTSILFGPWSQGASVFFYNGEFDPSKRFGLLAEYKITCFCAAATELRQLVLEDPKGADLSHLRSTVSAGESVNPEIVERWRALTGTTILDGYGQTETLMTITNRPGQEVKLGSMGKPLPKLEVAVLTDDPLVVSRGDSGELLLKLPNPQVMLSYWNDPERTEQTRINIDGVEWFRTGDNVSIDDDGYVFFVGRSDDIINSSGYRIGPQEVENALASHPQVKECAIAGIADEKRGELVKAWVILKEGIEGSNKMMEELQTHVKQVTAPYKYPRQIEFVTHLPKTTTGKIQRNVLRDMG